MKTVRFAQVVARSGKPEPYTLWTEPAQDRDFQAALEQHRVLSVHQESAGAKRDYGEVGYTADRHANLLVFPKSLEPFTGCRVVGVKYDLLAVAPSTVAPVPPPVEAVAVKATPVPKSSPAPDGPVAFPALRILHLAENKEKPAGKEQASGKPKPAPPSAAKQMPLALATEPATHQKAPSKPKLPPKAIPRPPDRPNPSREPGCETLVRQVRRAMKQLQDGKAVLAYQTLAAALRKQE